MKKFAIIVAGGKGARMGDSTPKQFLLLSGRPILMHTINRFFTFDPEIEIILVLPEGQLSEWELLCKNHNFNIPHKITKGGTTRFISVNNGLSLIEEEGIVFIHDGVRPLVSNQTILNCMDGAQKYNCAIPVIQLTDSIRQFTDVSNMAVDRSQYRLVQTPQTFNIRLLKEAFQKIDGTNFTDDASVFEAAGHKITLIDGNPENIKITTPSDLKIAEIFLQSEK
ncbi:2-C-methyl-D-erythritol 4-phosphate cytidylyltransferase [Sunxiuqinia sp. A32]|uniref:2-C-methyl-D-erythritol 4-phosphate cytidylyltransferase n=1 Tax=Sunxiuqinia sp. A32 TaxID=3461496 RepID=UPI004045DCF0